MRRWIFMAALSVVLLAIPLWGQRGGGMGGGRAGGVSHVGASSSAGTRAAFTGATYGGASLGAAGHAGYLHRPYPVRYPYYHFHYPYYGRYPWRYGYGWWGYPWVSWGGYGGIGWSNSYDSYPTQSAPAYAYANPDTSSADLAYEQQQQQIDQLNDEVARLRAERESAPNYAPSPAKPEIRASTVLVFRDHHSEEIQNYAIVGKTIWVFTEQRARKIPIAELDVPATTRANEDRGIDFRLPKVNQ